MKTGNINVQTENIFPIIKKFLYSDHEIFLRELVSNAVDATQKIKSLSQMGELKEELGDVYAMIDLFVEHDVVAWTELEERRNVKRKKLSRWSDLCQDEE